MTAAQTPVQGKILVHSGVTLVSVQRNELRGELGSQWIAQGLPSGFELIDTATWRADALSRAGSVEGWLWDTVNGKDYATRKPRFAGFLFPEPATDGLGAQLATLAFASSRPVFVRIGSTFCEARSVHRGVQDESTQTWLIESVSLSGDASA